MYAFVCMAERGGVLRSTTGAARYLLAESAERPHSRRVRTLRGEGGKNLPELPGDLVADLFCPGVRERAQSQFYGEEFGGPGVRGRWEGERVGKLPVAAAQVGEFVLDLGLNRVHLALGGEHMLLQPPVRP